ncbi:MAG: DUF58 domain-containing protein [Chloroflexi bacterium]|nr:DUF58 domain-containing protein [Chloroflexota bacterium]
MPRFPRLPWPGRARGHADESDEAARPLGEAPMLPAALLASMRRLELRARRLVATELAGEYRSVFRGFGIEFAEAREYVPGDDVRLIDWNVTARMGSPWVKEYTEERELHVVCAIDISASQLAGRPEQGRRAAAAEVCALLTLSAAYSQDRAGLLTFAGSPERFVPPDKGTRHALRIVREVLDHAPPGSSGTSLAAACDYLGRVLRRRSLVFLISDFLDDGYVRALRDLAQRHEVIAVTLIDPLDEALPDAGIVEVEGIEGSGRVLVDSSDPGLRDRYAAAARQRAELRREALSSAGVDEIEVRTDGDAASPVMTYFRRRAAGTQPRERPTGRRAYRARRG